MECVWVGVLDNRSCLCVGGDEDWGEVRGVLGVVMGGFEWQVMVGNECEIVGIEMWREGVGRASPSELAEISMCANIKTRLYLLENYTLPTLRPDSNTRNFIHVICTSIVNYFVFIEN
jgi:hypothetical protein